jgi:hypothetical protein
MTAIRTVCKILSTPAPRTNTADFEGLSSRFAVLILRFKGVDFEGVFCSPRGVGEYTLEVHTLETKYEHGKPA